MGLNLKEKVWLVVLVPSLLICFLVGFSCYPIIENQTEELATAKALIGSEFINKKLSIFFNERIAEITLISESEEIKSNDWKKYLPYLKNKINSYEGIYEKFVIGNLDGAFRTTVSGNTFHDMYNTHNDYIKDTSLKTIKTRDYWRATVENNRFNQKIHFVSDPMFGYVNDNKQIMVASSVLDERGNLIAMIGGSISWTVIEKEINKAKKIFEEKYGYPVNIAVLSSKLNFFYHWDKVKNVNFKKDSNGKYVLNSIGEKEVVYHSLEEEGNNTLKNFYLHIQDKGQLEGVVEDKYGLNFVTLMKVDGVNYYVMSYHPWATITAGMNKVKAIFILLLLSLIFISYLSSTVLLNFITEPMDKITKTARAILSGGKSVNTNILYSGDDLNSFNEIIKHAFNYLVDSENKLKFENEKLLDQVNSLNTEINNEKNRVDRDTLLHEIGVLSNLIVKEMESPIKMLNSYLSMISEILKDDKINKSKALSLINSCKESLWNAQELIESMINVGNLSEYEELQRISFKSLLEEALAINSERLKLNGIAVDITKVEDEIIDCHPHQIIQMLTTFISNSMQELRNIDERWISISSYVKLGKFHIEYMDSSLAKDINGEENILQVLESGKSTISLGLGLNIANQVAANHGGSVKYMSNQIHSKFAVEIAS